ncbi:ketosteroid isomerase-like protein [Mycobacterium frederiksbergense]|uniref:Ketosteroid isomerase-like protein n=1 Tax=Mycolicibacterium frederiksbergense TaxID=117567 RepID=A0ABT6L6B5_9MYCO|nr:nuclear transport factor 2 family protein [Mycolicibacterium frederiksbergense]MDH6198494.1 ketosteroid isomerase-like protein [Mycolicibacterium frederiksbergense]
MSTDEATVRALLNAMGRMDLGAIEGLLTDDVEWWLAGDLAVSGRHVGREAVLRDFLAAAAGMFEPGSLAFEVTHLWAHSGTVVAEYVGTARSRRGDAYRNHYCVVFTCRAGQVSAVREYLDTEHVARVLV